MTRFQIRMALMFGPWRLSNELGEPGGPRLFEDDVLEEHWFAWVRDEPPSPQRTVWDASDWAYRRFELGEEPVAAFIACRQLDAD